jgi:hypothetical protein
MVYSSISAIQGRPRMGYTGLWHLPVLVVVVSPAKKIASTVSGVGQLKGHNIRVCLVGPNSPSHPHSPSLFSLTTDQISGAAYDYLLNVGLKRSGERMCAARPVYTQGYRPNPSLFCAGHAHLLPVSLRLSVSSARRAPISTVLHSLPPSRLFRQFIVN